MYVSRLALADQKGLVEQGYICDRLDADASVCALVSRMLPLDLIRHYLLLVTRHVIVNDSSLSAQEDIVRAGDSLVLPYNCQEDQCHYIDALSIRRRVELLSRPLNRTW